MDDETQIQTPVGFQINPEEGILQESDPLTLTLDDDELVKVVDQRYKDSRSFFKDKYNLYERRRKNEMFLFGRQIAKKEKDKDLKLYEARYLDNVLYEIEQSLKPLAMSRLPDM
ncbi:unnamed protein product, partial [marine sediment metagenome]